MAQRTPPGHGESPAGPSPSGLPPAPIPRRLSRPKWLDPRVLIGLVLVVAAVVAGAKVIGASKHMTTVWAASRDLPAGAILTADDLERIDVNLADSTNKYLSADTAIEGRQLTYRLTVGDLVPIAAITAVPAGQRWVAVGVPSENMPPGVQHGSTIDLYLLPGSGLSGTPSVDDTQLIAKETVVQSVHAPSSGGLSGASSNEFQVVLMMPAAAADKIVRQLPQGDAFVVLVSGGQ